MSKALDSNAVVAEVTDAAAKQAQCGATESCYRDAFDRTNTLLNTVWRAATPAERSSLLPGQLQWLGEREHKYGTLPQDVTLENQAKPGTINQTATTPAEKQKELYEDTRERVLDLTGRIFPVENKGQ